MKYLAVSDVMALHDYYVGLFGGILGVRDDRLLDSAVFRCQASFDGQDLYKTIFEKAAAFFHSIIFDHPFVDGNKRTALFGAKRFLYLNGYILEMTNKEAVAFPLFVEETRPGVLDIAEWFKEHSRKRHQRRKK